MKNKKIISVLIIILIILIVLGGGFFYKKFKSSESIESIVKKSLTMPKYSADITYTCKNSRGEFTEKGTIEHISEHETKIDLGYVEQIFTEDKINLHYFKDEEKGIEDKIYNVDRTYDEFFKYFIINEIPQYLKDDSTTYNLDEEQENLILVEFLTYSKNVNFHKAVLRIDGKNKIAKSLSIYDNKGVERVEVTYSNFKVIK